MAVSLLNMNRISCLSLKLLSKNFSQQCGARETKKQLLSRLFQPRNVVPIGVKSSKDETVSKSQKLLLDMGYIRVSTTGIFHLLPLGCRVLEKLIKLVDQGMKGIAAQKVEMPTLIPADLWKTTGRWDDAVPELFTLRDRHGKEYCLGPTHEEAVTEIVGSLFGTSYRDFPLLLYQVTKKFRDEMKPRSGLLRSREFIMKDLYSFDVDIKNSRETYEAVCEAYGSLFRKIGLQHMQVIASSGTIGGSYSHEFHLLADVGEDGIVSCNKCGYGANQEVHDGLICPTCKGDLEKFTGIEVGHTFLLGTRYSEPLKATFINSSGKPDLLQMGCYGLGIGRILAGAVEVLSTDEEIRWPSLLAPYLVCIIPPKKGSNEDAVASHLAEELYYEIEAHIFPGDVIYDDRQNMTIGKRLLDARRTGFPFIIIAGKKSLEDEPHFELHRLQPGCEQVVMISRTDLHTLLMDARKEL